MADLVFIHGINNEGSDANTVRDEWVGYINEGLQIRGQTLDGHGLNIEAIYYGDKLKELVDKYRSWSLWGGARRNRQHNRVLARQTLLQPPQRFNHQFPSVEDLGNEAILGRSNSVTSQNDSQVPTRLNNNSYDRPVSINNLLGLIGSFVFGQGVAYAKKAKIADGVQAHVIDQMQEHISQDTVVLAHSLGSVVAYRWFAEPNINEPQGVNPSRFITMGSPLGLKEIQTSTKSEIGCLPAPTRWVNVYDRNDWAAFGMPLDKICFNCSTIIDHQVINGVGGITHDLDSYLQQDVVLDELVTAFNL